MIAAAARMPPADLPAVAAEPERSCRVCGCTDRNCSGCIELTGAPCSWVEQGLCSACAGAPAEVVYRVFVPGVPSRSREVLRHGDLAAARLALAAPKLLAALQADGADGNEPTALEWVAALLAHHGELIAARDRAEGPEWDEDRDATCRMRAAVVRFLREATAAVAAAAPRREPAS